MYNIFNDWAKIKHSDWLCTISISWLVRIWLIWHARRQVAKVNRTRSISDKTTHAWNHYGVDLDNFIEYSCIIDCEWPVQLLSGLLCAYCYQYSDFGQTGTAVLKHLVTGRCTQIYLLDKWIFANKKLSNSTLLFFANYKIFYYNF